MNSTVNMNTTRTENAQVNLDVKNNRNNFYQMEVQRCNSERLVTDYELELLTLSLLRNLYEREYEVNKDTTIRICRQNLLKKLSEKDIKWKSLDIQAQECISSRKEAKRKIKENSVECPSKKAKLDISTTTANSMQSMQNQGKGVQGLTNLIGGRIEQGVKAIARTRNGKQAKKTEVENITATQNKQNGKLDNDNADGSSYTTSKALPHQPEPTSCAVSSTETTILTVRDLIHVSSKHLEDLRNEKSRISPD